MTKKIETALIVLIYVLGTYLNWELAYIGCAFNFWPKGAYECAIAWVWKLSFFCLVIFWIPTYHFGLKGWLKMGIAFLCSGFIWLSIWTMVAMHYEITRWQLTILKMIIGVIVGGLYLYAYVGERKRRRGD